MSDSNRVDAIAGVSVEIKLLSFGATRKANVRFIRDGECIHADTGNLLSSAIRMRACRAAVHRIVKPGSKKDWLDEVAKVLDARVMAEADRCEAVARDEAANRKAEAEAAAGSRDPSEPDPCPYVESSGGIFHRRISQDGGENFVPLANFTAHITADVTRDDGAETQHIFELNARLGHEESTFNVPAPKFAAMDWPIEHLGASAILRPGVGSKDHARAAIQMLSGNIPRRNVYAHLGWLQRGDNNVFLHAGGAIGKDGPIDKIEVQLPDDLRNYVLPEPPDKKRLRECVQATLELLKLGPMHVVLPAWCAIWRAPMGGCDSSQYLAGGSGRFKSEFAALIQQHFGAAMDRTHLPANWSGTENAIEDILFTGKDVIVVVDDFAPSGGTNDILRLHQKADRIFRNVGNQSGRQRMRADGSMRPTRPPRGIVLATGEDVPRGHSIRARLHVTEVSKGDIDVPNLTIGQERARDGQFVSVMSAYICWLACQVGQVGQRLQRVRREVTELRTSLSDGGHRRTSEILANLALGLLQFQRFALFNEVITTKQAGLLKTEGFAALMRSAAMQQAEQAAVDPVDRFLDLLRSAIGSGAAHLADVNGKHPANPMACGWREVLGTQDLWRPEGARVGWMDGDSIFLDPDTAYAAVQRLGGYGAIAITELALWKRLNDKSLLIREPSRESLRCRKTLEGTRREVLHLKPGALLSITPYQPDQPDQTNDTGSEIEEFLSASSLGDAA